VVNCQNERRGLESKLRYRGEILASKKLKRREMTLVSKTASSRLKTKRCEKGRGPYLEIVQI